MRSTEAELEPTAPALWDERTGHKDSSPDEGPVIAILGEEKALAEAEVGAEPDLGRRFFNLRTLISFAFGIGFLVWVLTHVQVDYEAIFARVRQANPLLLVLGLVSFYATFVFRALRWRQMLGSVGFNSPGHRLPSTIGLAEIILLSWFANCIVPAKLGDAYRAYLLKSNAGVSFSRTIGTILAERIVDLLFLFGLMVLAASLSFGRALPPEVVLLMQVGFALAAIVIVGLIALKNIRPLVERLIPARFHAKYHAFEEGTLHSFRGLPMLLVYTTGAWAGEVARLYFVAMALGVGGVFPSVVLFVALAAALATTLPITPAGLGFAEGAIVAIFILAANAGMAPGVDEHAAASIALLDRTISYWSVIVVGFVVYLFSRRK